MLSTTSAAPARILSSTGLRGTTAVVKHKMSRGAFAGRLLREGVRHHVVVLNASVGIASLYDEPILAAMLARRGVTVLLSECIWEPGSRSIGRLSKRGQMLGVDRLPRTSRIATALIRALDHPRLHYAVLSTYDQQRFPETWGIDPKRVHFTPYWATAWSATPLDGGPAVFAGGDSLRDYRALTQAAAAIQGEVFIATRLAMPPTDAKNLTVRGVTPQEYSALSRAAKIHVVALAADSVRSAGQQTYLNAMALGRPVVVTDAPGVRDYVEHGVTGFVVAPDDPDELAGTINMLLATPNTAARVGAAAKEAVASRFTGRHYAQRLRQLAVSLAQE